MSATVHLQGDELIVEFRAWERQHRPGKRPLRVYACTGNATSTDAASYMKAGFDGCVLQTLLEGPRWAGRMVREASARFVSACARAPSVSSP